MNLQNWLQELIILAPPLLLSLTIHELAHGYVASRLGDPTARLAGRLTMNPLKHLDPIGTIAFFLVHLGWARPVPVNPRYFRDPRRDMLLVALAGPASNFILAVLCAVLAKLLLALPLIPLFLRLPLTGMLVAGVWINLVLGVFNFLPIPPLDGGRILLGILPERLAAAYGRIEPYGFLLLLLLFATGIVGNILQPVIRFAHGLLLG